MCAVCPDFNRCTGSRNHQKVLTRHLWEPYLEICEDICHTVGMKEWYGKRKETIERVFGTAKEFHGMRYTRYTGKALMEMKIGLTFACMNLKKLANMKKKQGLLGPDDNDFLFHLIRSLIQIDQKKSPSDAFAI